MFAVETGGWDKPSAQTVLVREPLVRSSVPSLVVVSKPVLAAGFAPKRIFARRSPGVVTVFSYLGASPGSASLEEGSGFVVGRSGVILTAAHVIVSTTGAGLLTQPATAVYVQFGDGDRVKAEVVGWDPYDDVGVLRVSPGSHRLVPVPLGTSSGLTVGQPVATIGSPFGAETSLSVGVVSGVGRTVPSLTTSYDLFDAIQTDAPDQPGQFRRPASRRRRQGHRDQRPDPLQPRVRVRGRRLRRADRLGEALARPVAQLRPRRLRLPRPSDREPDAVDREGLRLLLRARRDHRHRREGRARGQGRARSRDTGASSGRTSG